MAAGHVSRPDTTLEDLWIIDVATRTQITFDDGDATHPVWSADGKTIYYSSNGSNAADSD